MIPYLAALDILHQDDFEEKDEYNKGYLTECTLYCMLGKNLCSSGSQLHMHHTKPPPYQNGCSPKNCCSNHPCCQWLVRHSSIGSSYNSDDLLPYSVFILLLWWVLKKLIKTRGLSFKKNHQRVVTKKCSSLVEKKTRERNWALC